MAADDVVVIFVMAFALVAAGYYDVARCWIGIGAVAAALRLVLSDDRAGLLVVRTKSLDFATMVTFGATLPTSPPRSTRGTASPTVSRRCTP